MAHLDDYSGDFVPGLRAQDFSHEMLARLLKTYARLCMAVDGFWYLAVKDTAGNDAALACDIAVWQKQRETGFTDGMATTLVVLMIGTRTLWIGSVGDSSAYLFHNGTIKKLTREDVDSRGNLIKAIGTERFGLVPQFATEEFLAGDSVLLATDGVTRYMQQSDFEAFISPAGETSRDLTAAAQKLITLAQQNGGGDNMTVSLIKRIPFR